MISDLRFALRQLRKSPGFTIVAVFTLALGIGACSAIFTAVNAVLLRPISHPESERLVALLAETLDPERQRTPLPPADFMACAKQADLFESIAAQGRTPVTLLGQGEPAFVIMGLVKGPYFATLHTTPALGRLIGPADESPGDDRVVVLTHGFWQRHFGGREDVVGSTVQLNNESFTIVGVLPASFPVSAEEMYSPSRLPEQIWQSRNPTPFEITGRLKPGVPLAAAQAQLDTVAGRLAAQYPATNKNRGIRAVPLLEQKTENVRGTFYTLSAAVAVLLLIACANIANLLLVRAIHRQRELSVRAALGAGRMQVFRQLLAESLVLAVIGGGLGLLVGHWSLAALLALAPADLPRAPEIALDGRAVAFATAVTLLTGIGFGFAPAWHGARLNLIDALRSTTRIAGEGPNRRWLREGMVAVEIALALVLLVGAGLLIRSFARLASVPTGFAADEAVANIVMLPAKKYPGPDQRVRFCEAVLDRYRALPGVTSAGAIMSLPFAGMNWKTRINIEGRPVPEDERPSTVHSPVSPGYFGAMGIPLLRGRLFTAEDRGNPRVALVSRRFAERYFPGVDALGQRINLTADPKQACEIVGIVGDARVEDLQSETPPQSYEPFTQMMPMAVAFVVRSQAGIAALAPALRRELHAVDPDQPSWRLESLAHLVRATFARQRFAAILVGAFSSVALLLAAIGIYGVMAFTVAQRTGEFGLRLALGASASDLRQLVLRRGAKLVGLGLLAGAIGALATTRLVTSQLYATSPHDPWVFVAVASLLAAAALPACLIPARRATKVDPLEALRAE